MINRTHIILIFLFASTTVFAQATVELKSGAVIEFESETINLDTIAPVVYDIQAIFRFKNIGNEPLILTSCRGSGKGYGKYNPKPIMPNQTDSIIGVFTHLRFKQQDGAFDETLTIDGNFINGSKYEWKGETINVPYKLIHLTGYIKGTKK